MQTPSRPAELHETLLGSLSVDLEEHLVLWR